MSNNSPITFCFNAENQLWEQDMWNNHLLDRLFSNECVTNAFIPRPQSATNKNNFKTEPQWTPQASTLKNVEQESSLIYNKKPITKDCLTLDEARNLINSKKESQTLLYRTYHSHESTQSTYPNINRSMFDNTTKNIHNSSDQRNKYSVDPLISTKKNHN